MKFDTEELINRFEFLTKSEHFSNQETTYPYLRYQFHLKNQKEEHLAIITIAKKKTILPSWEYEINHEEYDKKIKKIEVTPDWFQDLFTKVLEKHEHATRLEKLFEDSAGISNGDSGVLHDFDQFLADLTGDII
jgi:hypothetical protein